MTFGCREAIELKVTVLLLCRSKNEHRSFVLNLVKHLPKIMTKVYGDDCLSRSRIHEWFKRFQEGREALKDDERSNHQPFTVFA